MGADRTTQSDLLHRVYLPGMRRQFNLKSILLQYIGRNTESYAEGEHLSLDLHYGRSGGMGWSSAGKLPAPGHQKHKKHTYNYGRMYATIEVSGPLEASTRAGYASQVRALANETKQMVRQMRPALNFDLFGDGTGKLAAPTGATSATTFEVDSVRGLADGDRIDVLLTATGAVGAGGISGADVSSVDAANLRITIDSTHGAQLADGGVDLAANPTNYTVYRHDTRNDVVMGLQGIVATGNPSGGNLGGIERVANPFWQANAFANGGVARLIHLPMIQEAINAIEKRTDCTTNLIICGFEVWTQLMTQMVSSKRFNGNTRKLNGWAEALDFNGVPIVRDKHCPPDKMFLLDTTAFTIYQNTEGEWITDDKGSRLVQVPGYDAFQAAWRRYLQLVCGIPAGQAVIEDLDTQIPAALAA